MSSLHPNGFHPDSSGQLPHNTPVSTPHPNPPPAHSPPPVHQPPHPTGGGFHFPGIPGLGGGGSRGFPKAKLPRTGGFTHPGTGIGFGLQHGLHGGMLDNRFLLDRRRFGIGRFRAELSAIERERFLAALRGCVGCDLNLLRFIFGLQYFPQFANLCTPRPTGCGVWVLGVNGCWFRVGSAEQAFISQLGLGGPAPVVIPCGGGFPVGFGGFHGLRGPRFGRGFPGGIHGHNHGFPGGIHPGGGHGGQHGFPGTGGGQHSGGGAQGPPGGFHPGDGGNDGTGAATGGQ